MGVFSSKKKTYVGMQVSRMLEDNEIVDLHQAAALDYTLGNNKRVDALATSFTDIYNMHLNGSIGTKALERRAWAKKKYYYGVMEGYRIKDDQLNFPAIFTEYMLSKGKIVDVQYTKFGPINNQHAVYQKLSDYFGYNPDTNQLDVLTQQNGFTTYLHDFTIHYCNDTVVNAVNTNYLNSLGYPAKHGQTHSRARDVNVAHTPWVHDTSAARDFAEIICTYKDGSGTIKYQTIQLEFLDYEYSDNLVDIEGTVIPEDAVLDGYYYMARYKENGVLKYFTYLYGSGIETFLEAAITGDVDPGKYLPQIYISVNRVKQNLDKESEAFKSSKSYCNSMGLKYDSLVDDMWNAIAEEESSVKDIIISHRLPVNTEDPIINKYLYYFFYEMFKDGSKTPVRNEDYNLFRKDITEQPISGFTLNLKDRINYNNITCSAISVRLVTGNIGPVGTATSEYNANIFKFKRIGLNGINLGSGGHYFRMQITPTVYREIHVRNLSMVQQVSGGYSQSASGSSENLLIPIDVEIVRKRLSKYRHELLCKSMHIIITTVKVVKVKWYQTGIFKVIMFVAAVALAYFTGGGSMAWYLALGKAILINIAMTIAVSVISKLLVSMGVDAGVIFAVIAVVAAIVGGYAAAAKTSVAGLKATQFMMIANTSFAISNNSQMLVMEKKYKAFLEYQDMHTERMEELEKLRKELGLEDAVKLDIFTLLSDNITRPDIRLGETPISFLERTTSVDAGKLPVAVVNNFVYLTTTLPTFESLMQKRNPSYV